MVNDHGSLQKTYFNNRSILNKFTLYPLNQVNKHIHSVQICRTKNEQASNNQ